MSYSNFRNPEKVKKIDKLINKLSDIRNKDMNFSDRNFNKEVDKKFLELQEFLIANKKLEIK